MVKENADIQQKSSKKVIGRPFQKGQSGNPLGKKKGTLDEVTKFKRAIELFEKKQGKTFYEILLERALRNPQVLVAIFKALVPQKSEIEGIDKIVTINLIPVSSKSEAEKLKEND
jgi:hypothetical protein